MSLFVGCLICFRIGQQNNSQCIINNPKVVSSLLREYKEKLTFFKFLLKDLEHSTLTGMTTAKKTKKLKEERAWFTTAYKQPQLVLALLKASSVNTDR